VIRQREFIDGRAGGLAAAAVLFGLAALAVVSRMSAVWTDTEVLAVFASASLIPYVLGPLGPATVDRRPAASTSVLLIVGLLIALPALLQLATVLGVNDPFAESSTLTWVFAAWGVLSLVAAVGPGSAIAALLGAAAAIGVVLAGSDWLFDLSGLDTFRYLLLSLTVVFFLSGLAVGGQRPRHGVVLVDAAGVATIALGILLTIELFVGLFGGIATSLLSGGDQTASATIPWGWELFQLVVGLALVGFSARDREPGPGYLGLVVLSFFLVGAVVKIEQSPSITGWPLALLIMGAVVLAVTLRPRRRA
jgi:hypothetical protein